MLLHIKYYFTEMGIFSFELLKPKDFQLPSAWAEENVYISLGNARPGMISFSDMPYQREIIDASVQKDCYRISLECAAQIGKTICALCMMGYYVDFSPRSQIVMMPTEDDSKIWSETKFIPLLLDNKRLLDLISKPYEKKLGKTSTAQLRSFPGGWLMFAWAGSANTARSRSAPVIICDEVDAYEYLAEGHPVDLVSQRSVTFGRQKLLVELSTPTVEGSSRIETSFEEGDQRKFHVTCPRCKVEQTLEWGDETVKWDTEKTGELIPESARYVCACGKEFDDNERRALVRHPSSRWIAGKKKFRGHASFQLNALYSPMRSLSEIIQTYISMDKQKSLQTFFNTCLGLPWNTVGEKTDSNMLYARRENYVTVPEQVKALTAGIDVQGNRVEIEVAGWGDAEESWCIDYATIYGDPTTKKLWDALDEYLQKTWEKEDGGEIGIIGGAIDTGYNTQYVYEYVLGRLKSRKKPSLFAIKGVGGFEREPFTLTNRNKSSKGRRPPLWSIGVDIIKMVITRKLNIEKHGTSFCHFSMDRDIDYFNQLTAEQLVTKIVKGFPKRQWEKIFEFNEAFDCRIYAYSAYKIIYPHGIMSRKAPKASGKVKGL